MPNTKASIKDTRNRPMRDLRISVTDRCNFRCPYCMPAEVYGERYHFMPKEQMLSFEEIDRLARIFVKLGVNKLRLTGGEPLVRNDLHKLIGMLAKIDNVDDLTLTTNGYLLADQAKALKNAGLRRITVSLDSLDDEVFAKMNGRGFGTKRVLEGIAAAEKVGLSPIKLNTVVQKGVNDHTIVDLARRFKGTGHIIRFIEYMDVGNLNGWKLDQVVPSREVVRMISEQMPLEPAEPNYLGEVAERYRYVDGTGEIGVISSVTQPFCGDCTRARLSTDGKLFTCLFASQGTDLKTPMRKGATDNELDALISKVWLGRTDRYSELRAHLTAKPGSEKIEMFQIGG